MSRRRPSWTEGDPNGSDYAVAYYPRPRCVVCGRLAGRTSSGWAFSCYSGDAASGWWHQ